MKYMFMFNDLFIDALRQYKNSDFKYSKAKKIFERYGTTVLESGFVGGFAERRAIMTGREFEDKIDDSTEAKACYQKAVQVEASYGGFSGSTAVDTSNCKSDGLAAMQASRRTMTNEQTDRRTVGGELSAEDFVVTPDSAELLTSSKMYPNGKKLRLRLLTDYLAKDKIHPWEYKQWHLLPDDFKEIHSKLEKHIYDFLKEKDSAISNCAPCAGSLYLEEDTSTDPSTFKCGCYFFALQERSLRPAQVRGDSLFGYSCDMSRDVAVVSAPEVRDSGGYNRQGRVFLYVDGELKKEIIPRTNGSGRDVYFGLEGLAIDEYIVAYTLRGVEVYDRNGNFKKSIGYMLGSLVTAGDLFAGVQYNYPYKLQVYRISTGAKVFELDVGGWAILAMTTEYLAVSLVDKIYIYSIKSNSVATHFTPVGEISLPDPQHRYAFLDIHEDRIAVASHSRDSGGFGAIYDTTGALVVSLEIDNTDDNFKQYFADDWYTGNQLALNDKYVIVGAPMESRKSGEGGAVYVFDAVTGETLEKKRSLNPKKNDFYGDCVALSGNYMISTALGDNFDSYSVIPEAYFQTVISTSNEIYTDATSGIDEIITAEN